MILLLGATGYMGQAFATELRRRGYNFIPLTRQAFDYTNFDLLFDYVRKMRPEFIINAAGYVGKPNEETCELEHGETLFANTFLPQTIEKVCSMTNTPWGHISSGNIYCGAKVFQNREKRIVRDLQQSEIQELHASHPEMFFGFTEWDEPNYSFRCAPCSFYSGSKALAEESIRNNKQTYIWRPALPFNERDERRNFISRVKRYSGVRDGIHSLSHLEDFVTACLELWERQSPYGIYNIANPGVITRGQLLDMMARNLDSGSGYEFGKEKDTDRYYRLGTELPQASYILDVSKLLATGIRMRPVRAALQDSLRKWQAAATLEMAGVGDN